MEAHKFSCLTVLDKDGRLAGITAESDILRMLVKTCQKVPEPFLAPA